VSAIDDRLARIEARLARLEQVVAGGIAPTPDAQAAAASASDAAVQANAPAPLAPPAAAPGGHPLPDGVVVAPAPPAAPRGRGRVAGNVMAWGAAASFVLAAVYFIRLVLESGWLTPARQLGIGTLIGSALIAFGLRLARYDRGYAAHLPAVGIVLLYLQAHGAHLYYGLIGTHAALSAVAAISIAAIALGARFRRSAYAVLAGLCVYTAPLLLAGVRSGTLELIVYFTAWSLVFSWCALQERRRLTYLVPMYLAFLCFDYAWRLSGSDAWQLAATYQLLQFVTFACTATWLSIRSGQRLTGEEALAHALPLLYFYAVEYALISAHAPVVARVLALASAVALLGLQALARRRMAAKDADSPASVLVAAYCSLVTTHVVFFESLPERYLPWAALVLPPTLLLVARGAAGGGAAPTLRPVLVPVWLAAAGVSLLGFGMVLLPDLAAEPALAPRVALAAYAALMYAACLTPMARTLGGLRPGVLYAAHGATMVLALRLLDGAFAVSLAWAALAVVMLLLALRRQERLLGQSALLIFAASALKVLLFDLSGSAPLVRIGVLVVLGSSLYAGGWLYQGLMRATTTFHPEPRVNAQIARIAALVVQGMDDAAIAGCLTRDGVECLARGGWSAALVARIRADYGLGDAADSAGAGAA
jgi:uncharacterized membrane protein